MWIVLDNECKRIMDIRTMLGLKCSELRKDCLKYSENKQHSELLKAQETYHACSVLLEHYDMLYKNFNKVNNYEG